MSNDLANQFPSLSPEQLAAMRGAIAGLESLPALIERLHGISATLTESRALTPALALGQPLPGRWPEETPAPLSVDRLGYLRTRTRRSLLRLPDLVIRQGQQNGVPVTNPLTSGELTWEDIGLGVVLFDDPARTETVQVQGTLDGGTNWWASPPLSLFSGAFNSVQAQNSISISMYICSQLRMRATAAPVGADRVFPVYAFAQ